MNNKSFILLRTLLKSTSSMNILKTTNDRKKKGKIIGSYIGMAILYLMLIAYCLLMAVGYAFFNLGDQLPQLAAITICTLSFVFTLLKAGSYLFGFREYEMLMALPFSEKTIVSSKFMYMYMKNLPWNLSISIAMLVGYMFLARPPIYALLLWTVLSLFLPIIPMLLASFIGYFIARIGTMFKHWKTVQIILTFAFVMLAFSARFIIESIFRNNEVKDALENFSTTATRIGNYYFPIGWFGKAVSEGNVVYGVLLIGLTVFLYELLFNIISLSYKKMNSIMKTDAATDHNFKLTGQKRKSPAEAIAEKEIRRFVSSTNYFVNVSIGYILAVVVGVIALIFGLDKVIGFITQGAPISTQMMIPAIPFVVYFMTGMMQMTVCSPSLEGKNYWILKSSPVTGKEIYMGKILASLYIAIPAQLLSTLLICIGAGVPVLTTIGFLILGVILCIFSAVFGCACGVHFMKLDWENEVEVIKQGTAVLIYMFPNMILTMAALLGSIFLGKAAGTGIVIFAGLLLYSLLGLVFLFRVKKLIRDLEF